MEQNPILEHARRELEIAGLFSKQSDYGGKLAPAVLALVEVFVAQNHSGSSAGIIRQLFSKLTNFEPLTPLTNDPGEWTHVAEQDGKELFQSQRNSEAFSVDGGKHYYLLSETSSLVRCTGCSSAWSGAPRTALGEEDKHCKGCGASMQLVRPGIDRAAPEALHESESRK